MASNANECSVRGMQIFPTDLSDNDDGKGPKCTICSNISIIQTIMTDERIAQERHHHEQADCHR